MVLLMASELIPAVHLSNIGFGLLKRRETARSFSNDSFCLFFHRQRVSLPGETLLEQSCAHQSA